MLSTTLFFNTANFIDHSLLGNACVQIKYYIYSKLYVIVIP